MRQIFIIFGMTFLFILAASNSGQAQELRTSLLTCKQMPNDRNRLSCLDQILSSLEEYTESLPAVLPQPDQTFGQSPARMQTADGKPSRIPGTGIFRSVQDLFGRESLERETSDIETKSLTAQAIQIGQNGRKKYIVTLDNGQVWRQIQADSNKLQIYKGMFPIGVVIKKKSLGSYLLRLKNSNRSIRVKRIK